MTPDDRATLLAIVRTHLATHSIDDTAHAIREAHNGRPDDDLVTSANLHLFRQYRNDVSAAPADLITEATH